MAPDYEQANIAVLVKPFKPTPWETFHGMAVFSKSGRTVYVYQDDTTVDTFRLQSDGSYLCFHVPKQRWKIKVKGGCHMSRRNAMK